MQGMDTLSALRHNKQREREAKRLREAIAEDRARLIKQAFEEGHTGPEIATAAGCSKERAYQLRDDRSGKLGRGAAARLAGLPILDDAGPQLKSC